ncbi:MAG: pyruvate, phosphate dikinase [Deltaproteobacteria bacterium]|nr:pyruvate, phosphate dikinase [Deltaproteobacteria bacterium]
MTIKSKALEVNIADYHVDVSIDPKYAVLQEAMSSYYGIMEGLGTFLKELSHPYKNWQFIVNEARSYSLDYFHLLKAHPQGDEAVRLLIGIFQAAVRANIPVQAKRDAVDNLLLYLQKIIKESKEKQATFVPVLMDAFKEIRQYDQPTFFLFVTSYYQLKKLAEVFRGSLDISGLDLTELNLLLVHNFETAYDFWLKQKDPSDWFEEEVEMLDPGNKWKQIFRDISRDRIFAWKKGLDGIVRREDPGSAEMLDQLMGLAGYNQIADMYRGMPQRLLDAGRDSNKGNQWKMIFLFLIMHISELSIIHEETLRDINRTLTWLIGNETHFYIRKLMQKTFSILQKQTDAFPATALNCVLTMGKGIYQTEDSELVNDFIEHVIDLGFQAPMITGVGDDWQVMVNPAHIQNIRTWMELIILGPKRSVRLISCMIIHLSLCGVFIKDTDLFPRDITRILNSRIGQVYNLLKQLAKLFPVYFNDIGAEGKLRDISTRLDEIAHRKDELIHFLRKQSHVESSNLIIGFMEAAFTFWETRDKTLLKPYVPPVIYNRIEDKGVYVDGMHQTVRYLRQKGVSLPGDLISLDGEKIKALLDGASDLQKEDVERVTLAISFYKHLHQKYNLDFIEINNHVARLKAEAFPGLDQLEDALKEPELDKKIFMMLDYLEFLKYLILSNESFEVKEDIYKKRHFTVDIPSMYGSYHEMKFDALGLTFRLESLVNTLFEELVDRIDLSLITKATFFQIYDRLLLFDKALHIEGIHSVELERQLEMLAHSLEIRGFTFTQYIDIFKGFAQAVKNIINDYFANVHGQNLNTILTKLPPGAILGRFLPKDGLQDRDKARHRISEIFFRDRIAFTTGLRQLDLFLSRILNTLFQQSNKLPKDKLHQLLLYDPHNAMTYIHDVGKRVSGIIHLGNKGLNMAKLKSFGLPVPPGFVITTEVYRCWDIIESYLPAEENFKEQVTRHIHTIEGKTGRNFGDPGNPLLFSVRSGSSISQPGMMDTFLNVGVNEEITRGLAALTGNEWFAWDNYRRFLQCYGMSFGLKRDEFDAIISELKRRAAVRFKRDMSGQQMQKVAIAYKRHIKESGIEVPEDPMEQLFITIRNVLASWESSKARTYRRIMGISDDWGTAVTVQTMVYGNMSEQSGAGVFFTHNPRWSGDSIRLWGDFTIGNQGEDVVSGLVTTLPISITQQDIEMRETDITLETAFPEIYAAMKSWAVELVEKREWSPQEMEFTFEGPSPGDLYLLQTRDMAMRERKKELTFVDPGHTGDDRMLGHGIGVSGGAMSGRLVFTLKEIDNWRSTEPDTPLILVRGDTVPDDIREIYASDGLLTARGGVTSHAAVVAHRLGKTGVVGCGSMRCDEKEKVCIFSSIRLESGDYISIDGREGSVYRGMLELDEA